MVSFRHTARSKALLAHMGAEEAGGTSIWLQVPGLQDTWAERDRGLFGEMCILMLPQITLPRTPSLPGDLYVAEASSLNNTDRKRWRIQKSFWSHSTKHDCRVETAKNLEGHLTFSCWYLGCAWLKLKLWQELHGQFWVKNTSLCCSCCWSTGNPSSIFSGNHWSYL